MLWCCVPALHATTIAGASVTPSSPLTQNLASGAPLADRATIEELLLLDKQVAINAARRNMFGVTGGTHSLVASESHPVVQAIYGTGRALTAEVLIDGFTHIFKSARRAPLSGNASGYQLERITPPCIYLTKAQNQEISCLDVSRP